MCSGRAPDKGCTSRSVHCFKNKIVDIGNKKAFCIRVTDVCLQLTKTNCWTTDTAKLAARFISSHCRAACGTALSHGWRFATMSGRARAAPLQTAEWVSEKINRRLLPTLPGNSCMYHLVQAWRVQPCWLPWELRAQSTFQESPSGIRPINYGAICSYLWIDEAIVVHTTDWPPEVGTPCFCTRWPHIYT